MRLDLAQQRGAGHAPHRCQRPCAVRGRSGERGGRLRAGHADRDRCDRAIMPSSASRRRPSISPTAASAAAPAPNGLDAFVYAERGVYRSGETAYLTALLRDAQGAAALGVPLTLVVERPDGVEFRRAAGGRPGPRRPRPDLAARRPRRRPAPGMCAPTPIRNARPSARRRSWSRIMCRIASNSISTSPSGHISQKVPAKVSVAGRFLYGAPAADLDLEGDVTIAAAKERPGFAGYQFGLADEEVEAVQQPLEDLPDDRRRRQGEVPRQSRQAAVEHASARGADHRAHGRARRPRRRAQDHAAGHAERQHDRRQAARSPAARSPTAPTPTFDVVVVAPDGKRRRAARPALRAAAHRHPLSVVQARRQLELRAGQDAPSASPTARSTRRSTKPARISLPVNFGRYRLEVSTADAERAGDVGGVRRRLLCRVERRYARHARRSRSTRASTRPATP